MPEDNANDDEEFEVEDDSVDEMEIDDVDEDVSVEGEIDVEEGEDDVEVTEEITVESEGDEQLQFEEDVSGDDEEGPRATIAKSRERLGEGADRAVEQFDERLVDLLSWVLDTETRARIYVFLRQHEASTSEEIASGTGLYPSTVREALAELHEETKVSRQKRESEGAGNNPYEYTAIAPSELVGGVIGQIQDELNTVINLDRHLGKDAGDAESEPVTINVEEGAGDVSADEPESDE